MKFTACYTKIEAGYMGQLLEWPEVITEGATLDECREMLIDAIQEMLGVYRDDGLTVPQPSILLEPITAHAREAALAHVS